jgi:hypothetical protein
VGVCRSPGFSGVVAFQEYIYQVGVAEVGWHITSKLTATLGFRKEQNENDQNGFACCWVSILNVDLLNCWMRYGS